MKYLRTYDNLNYGQKFWLLPTDERYFDSIDKIGCPRSFADVIRQTLFSEYKSRNNINYVYISFNINNIDGMRGGYGWMPFRDDFNLNNFYKENGYKFMGMVNINDNEEFVIKNSHKFNKYNL